MTISSEVRKAGPFNGNDVTTSFPFSFKVFDKGDLRVVRTMPSGIEADLILDSDYSVTLNPDQDATPGGTVTFPISGDPLAEDWKLTIVGDIDALQPTDLTNGGGFYPQVIENMSDRLTMLVQQLEEELGRTIRISVSDATTGGLELPAAGSRPDRVLGFDANGNFTTYPLATATLQAAYESFTATTGQTDLALPFSYTPGVNAVYVFGNGSKLKSGVDYQEVSETLIRLVSGAAGGDLLEVITGIPLSDSNAGLAGVQVRYADDFAAATTLALSLPDGATVISPDADGIMTRYTVASGVLTNPIPEDAISVARSIISVGSLAELSALDARDGLSASLLLGGRSGIFRFDASNLASEVSGDTLQGIYVAPQSSPDGSNGAWVRQYGQSVAYNTPVKAVWWGLDEYAEANASIQSALSHGDEVILPDGEITIGGTGVVVGTGQTLVGVRGSETGTRYATSGTRLVPSAGCTRFVYISKGGDSTADSAGLVNIAFNGSNQDFGVQSDECRQCKFHGLRFSNIKRCFSFEGDAWLNSFEDIKAFDFDRFAHFESGGEDTTFRQVIARGYRAGSIGVRVNYYGQTMYFDGCDLSECEAPYSASIGLGDHVVIFDSCYFELGLTSTLGAIAVAAASGSTVSVMLNGCRIFNKVGVSLANSTAVRASGAGRVEIESNMSKFSSIHRLIHDAGQSGTPTITRVSGQSNLINGAISTIAYSGVRDSAKQMGFFGVDNVRNLSGLDIPYVVTHDFSSAFTFDFDLVESVTGIYEIVITTSNAPASLARIMYQPKGFFSNGVATEITDKDGVFTQSVSANTLTITRSAASTCRIVIRKIA